MQQSTLSLQDQLDNISANTRLLVGPERLARTEAVVAELQTAGIEARILPVGATAPPFALIAANGKLVRSEDLLALGPLILKFFRGRWCPYDMTELEAWQALLPELRARHALFVAVSPQTPRQNAFTASGQNKPEGLSFPILSDPGAAVATQFGLAYTVPEPNRAWYRSMLVNIPLLHGDDDWRLPLPALFVIGKDGRILRSAANADHRLRPDPTAVLATLSRA